MRIGNSEIDGAFCIPNDFVIEAARQKCTYGCDTGNDCPETGFTACPMACVKFCRSKLDVLPTGCLAFAAG
jgi:hypothetical protein